MKLGSKRKCKYQSSLDKSFKQLYQESTEIVFELVDELVNLLKSKYYDFDDSVATRNFIAAAYDVITISEMIDDLKRVN